MTTPLTLGRYVADLTEKHSLGKNQASVLRTMLDREYLWSPGCGWTWDSLSATERILDSLVRKGLVTKAQRETPGRISRTVNVYRLVDEHREVADQIKAAQGAAQREENRRRNEQYEADRREREARLAATSDLMDRHAEEFNALLAKHRERLAADVTKEVQV